MLMVLIIFLFTAIFGRLIYLMVISSESLQIKALDQWTRDVPVTGERGDIYDVNGVLLADTGTIYTVYVRPNSVTDKAYTAQILSSILGIDEKKLYDRINAKVSEVTVSKNVTSEQISLIYAAKPTGVYYAQNIKRNYIYGDFSSMVLGFTNIDGVGQTGIEAQYNSYLQGIDGKLLTETDLIGRELDSNLTYYIEGVKGADLYLTLDYSIQRFVQNAVNDAYETHQAKSASCVVMNAKTGAIVAMAQSPSFDLNNIPRNDIAKLMEVSRNTIISDVYEPGSTFKVLTAALGLEYGVVNTSTTRCYCGGSRIVDGTKIKCWRTIGHGSQTFAEAVQNSCNCMFMDIALGLGKEQLYTGLKSFGICDKTGIDASGEASGLMINYDIVKNVDIARIGFGQAVAVTAIELLTACAAAVNGGELLTPYLVDKIVQGGEILYKGNKNIRNNVISAETSRTMREIFEGVVRDGGGKNAQVNGYRIGGKTGTAQKYSESGGGIAGGKYVATFMGFAPADNPEYIMLFIVDEPSTGAYYGSVVAAPYASTIFSQIFEYRGWQPENTVALPKFEMPDLIGLSLTEASAILAQKGLYYEYYGEVGNGNKVTYQLPAPGSYVNKNNAVYISLSQE